MFDFNVSQLGDFLLHLAVVVAVFTGVASVVGLRRRDGRLMLAGERAGYALTGIIVAASCLLIHSFLTHDYLNKYVARHSDNNMPWYYLIASFWGGQAGSLMFWCFVLSIITAIVIWQNREQNRDVLPTVLTVLCVVQVFFLVLMLREANPFATFMIQEPPVNGKGLEPLLQNPAMTFHPPSILSGYVWFTVPFAFAVAALIHKRLDDSWIRTTRRYAVVSWAFLSLGNLFGGMWAYQELGWGGFWGWDPVENAAFMPWIMATAYLHSVQIQEKRGMLKVWNIALVMLTYFLTVFGTFLTRSGLIDSVHTFAQSDVGNYFIVYLIVLAVVSIGLLLWRVLDGSLKSDGHIEALMSREGVFLLNNLVLVAMTSVVMFGTIGEKLSEFFWQKTKYGAGWFNTWMTPIGLTLLLLMGIGPLIPWRKATWKNFRQNFLVALVVALAFAAVIVGFNVHHVQDELRETTLRFSSLGRVLFDSELEGVYAIVGFFAVGFVFYTLIGEFLRGARIRQKNTQENFPTALVRLAAKNKRRYGGYLTHLGFASLFLGFIGTGLKTEVDLTFTGVGSTHLIEDKQLTFEGFSRTDSREYEEWFAKFTVRAQSEGQPGEVLGTLTPSRRFYHGANVQLSRTTTEKDELYGFAANTYLALVSFRPQLESVEIMAHHNPMILWMWIGGALLLLGVVFAIWPETQPYPVYAAARRKARAKSADLDEASAVPDASTASRQSST